MLDLLLSLADEPAAPAEFTLVRVSRRAMATTFEVAVPAGTPDAIPAAEDALDLIDQLEDQMTVYRDHSEVSRLNASAATGPVVVEERLFDLFATCAGWTRETDGAFDIAAGALVKAWGFYRREGRVPTPRERAEAMARTGTRHLILNPLTPHPPLRGDLPHKGGGDKTAAAGQLLTSTLVGEVGSRSDPSGGGQAGGTVRFRVPGLEINLGAVGKGYALDRAAELLRQKWGIPSALLHGGGSSVYAIGHPPGDPRGWAVSLKHPSEEGRTLGTLRLRDRGLGTSAATYQFFEYNGRKLGHLLDPRTGWPVEGTAGASVTAPTAAEADAMSTALFVLGAGGADRLTRTRPHLGAVVLSNPSPDPSPARGGEENRTPPSLAGKGVGGLGLRTFNLAPPDYSPPDADRHR